MTTSATRLATALAVLVAVLYSVLAHWLTVHDDRSDASYLFALGSLYLACGGIALASRHRLPILLAATASVGALWWLHRISDWDPRWVYLLQHAGTLGTLGLAFGSTLAPGATPLVSRLAATVHGPLDPDMAAYTRGVTLAWTVFFATMTTASLVLYLGGHAWWWSVLANFLTLPAVVLMFVIEYAIRRLRFPAFEHASLMDGVLAFRRMRRSQPSMPPAP
jgi:uncharacterized membrane protein